MPTSTAPAVMVAMRYQDANAAITWLEKALGFTQRVVYRDPDGRVAHAELLLQTASGTGLVMLGSTKAAGAVDAAPWYRQPADAGGVTSSVYVVVPVCAPLYQQAVDAGAEVLTPLQNMDYGGAAFTLRDPEGFVWSVGEYDPWQQPEPSGEA